MAALIPSRSDAEANERAIGGVRADKQREAGDGFDGTWVAHPDLVPVATEAFDAVLGLRPNQVDRQRDDVQVSAEQLLDARSAFDAGGAITSRAAQRRQRGHPVHLLVAARQRRGGHLRPHGGRRHGGDRALAGLQWIRHGAQLEDFRTITTELVRDIATSELERIRAEIATTSGSSARDARALGTSSRRSRSPTGSSSS